MSLKRDSESPLLSDEDVLRRAALLQLVHRPSLEGAKAIIHALIHFLQDRPELSREFEDVLYTPPLGRLAEEPVLALLDHDSDEVRAIAARILFKLGVSTRSREKLAAALEGDSNPWTRVYAAKALALLPSGNAGPLLVEAIDNEALPEFVARIGDALALLGNAAHAEVLRDQATQLRDRVQPASNLLPPALWAEQAEGYALYLEALGGLLEGTLTVLEPGIWRHGTTVLLAGGPNVGGHAARVKVSSSQMLLEHDADEALRSLAKHAFEG
jgi:hypothetical protein